jgi:hypothetical protein
MMQVNNAILQSNFVAGNRILSDQRFYKIYIPKGQILCVVLRAKHDQSLDFVKGEAFELISIDKITYVIQQGSRWNVQKTCEGIKVYIRPKYSFLLNWKYVTDTGSENTLYTQIEVPK